MCLGNREVGKGLDSWKTGLMKQSGVLSVFVKCRSGAENVKNQK